MFLYYAQMCNHFFDFSSKQGNFSGKVVKVRRAQFGHEVA